MHALEHVYLRKELNFEDFYAHLKNLKFLKLNSEAVSLLIKINFIAN